ncbi:hypothetical protein AACH10_00960 [Ideonella sp. DXS22W]|uniref:DUF1488 domain-containing protein n=1 Tax=Pseudaquabacterium inlustre TaxID=2984192 RepID=A0ABU9CAD8_9BURK
MHPSDNMLQIDDGFELRFESLFVEGRGLAFPCDREGHVDLDALSERARSNYLYARAVVGREYRQPAVCRSQGH